jgi:hypothetical protein
MKNRNFVSICGMCDFEIDKAPRSRSKKIRRFDHVDLTKEFEIRN